MVKGLYDFLLIGGTLAIGAYVLYRLYEQRQINQQNAAVSAEYNAYVQNIAEQSAFSNLNAYIASFQPTTYSAGLPTSNELPVAG